eukprot:CAMPEP_0170755714 /NCGR_PEP_ID=MMETSP0437-20130122/13659_1 /TAXON_ID=0 /ORGANISM="Sexangularia sp." /LENGTH=233 /DNA_ID=CAMNT_0011094889 /DNA_START=49 /DNA_END=747 /DNA_ORIENTATION=+
MFSLPSASSLRKANAENVGPRVAPRQGAPAARPTPASLKGTSVPRSFGANLNTNNRGGDGSVSRPTARSSATTNKDAATVVPVPSEAQYTGADERVRGRKAKPSARFAGPVSSRARASSRTSKVAPIDAMPRPSWQPSELEDPGMLALDGLLEVDRFVMQRRQTASSTSAAPHLQPLSFDEPESLSSFAPLTSLLATAAPASSHEKPLSFDEPESLSSFAPLPSLLATAAPAS